MPFDKSSKCSFSFDMVLIRLRYPGTGYGYILILILLDYLLPRYRTFYIFIPYFIFFAGTGTVPYGNFLINFNLFPYINVGARSTKLCTYLHCGKYTNISTENRYIMLLDT